ncbi:MAG TPA: GAF domain-containing protein, partial [Actinomycetales bacterium]
MEPLPTSRQVIQQLEETSGEDLLSPLTDVGEALTDIVPTCLGFSMSYLREGVAVTFSASEPMIAAMDAVQYAAGGPCVDALDNEALLRTDDISDALGERMWHVFAGVASAHGVRSTLSYPLHDGDRVIGGINIYASTPGAFEGKVDAVAQLFGTWAHEATSNADLSWSTRDAAERGPELLHEATIVNQALGLLAAHE